MTSPQRQLDRPPRRLDRPPSRPVSSLYGDGDDISSLSGQGDLGRGRLRSGRSDMSLASQRPSSSGISSVPRVATSGPIGLKKQLGLVSGVAMIVGTMIGSGIFISPTGVAKGSGSVGLSMMNWVICGVISLLGSFAYAELGALLPKSGAEYTYLREAFGALAAFLFYWVCAFMLRPAGIAIMALTCAQYLLAPMFQTCDNLHSGGKQLLAAVLILLVTVINCMSVRLAAWLQNALTFAKLAAMVIIIITGFIKLAHVMVAVMNCYSVKMATRIQVFFTGCKLLALFALISGGMVKLLQGNTQFLASGFEGTSNNPGLIAIGLYHGMWAYDGWNNLNYVTEEIINPSKNLPRAIMIGIPLVTVCYVLVNISYFTVMSVEDMPNSAAVAITFGDHFNLGLSWLMQLFVSASAFGAVNGEIFGASRLSYVAAREGHTLEILSMIHVKKLTPLPSLVFTALLAVIYIIPGNIETLIGFFNFAVWFFYGSTMVALIVLRFTMKDAHRPFKVPIVIPIFVLLFSIFLVLAPIITEPRLEFLYAFLFIVGGLIFYFPFVYFKKYPPFMEGFTAFCQMLLEVSIPTEQPEEEER